MRFKLAGLSNVQASCLLATLFFPFYLAAMAPSVTVGDSGEFIASAATLSLPHAPSYPLFVLLGKAAIVMTPWAHAAYAVNLISLFFGILACVAIYLLARANALSAFVSVILSLIFLASAILREQSAVTEVFSLNTFFAAFLLLCLSAPVEKIPRDRKYCLISFLLGFGLGNHHTLVLIAPALALAFALESREGQALNGAAGNIIRGLPAWSLFFILGFSIYIFLPVRSFQNPPIDWSNPETAKNFIRVITRADYGSFSLALGEKLPRNWQTLMGQMVRYIDGMAGNIGWTCIVLSGLGWLVWFLRDRMAASIYFLFFILSGAGFLILGNMPFDSQSTGILPRFFLMSAVPLIIAAGVFLEEARKRMPGIHFLFVLIPIGILAGHFSGFNLYRRDFFAHDYGRNLLKTLEPGSALFMDGGDDTFYTLAYFNLAQGLRKDLEIHDRGGLIFRNPYGDDFRMISKAQKEERRREVESSALGMRPLYYSTFNREILPGAVLLHRGLLSQARPFSGNHKSSEARKLAAEDYQERGRFIWNFYSERGVYGPVPDHSYRLRALLPIYPFLEGLPRGDLSLFKRAAHFGTDVLWLQSNLVWEASVRGYELSNSGRVDEAEKLYRFAIAVDPKYAGAYCNLGVLMERKNNFKEAESYYKQSIERDSRYAEAYYNLGVLYWKTSRWADVVKTFEKTIELSPGHPTAGRYLQLARQKSLEASRKK